MWGNILSGLKTAGKFLGSSKGSKVAELGTSALGAYLNDRGAKQANNMEAGVRNVDILAQPTARRDAIVHDENVAGSQAQAGSLANNMADRTQQQALKLAILSGANMGGVEAPSFLAGKTGNVSGPKWSPEQMLALRDSWDKGNQNVQTSIEDLRARKTSPLTDLTMGAAAEERARQKILYDNMTKQAMESGILGEDAKPKESWYSKWLKPALGIGAGVAGAALLGKYGPKGPMGAESKLPGIDISTILGGIGKQLPPEQLDPSAIMYDKIKKFTPKFGGK